MNDSRREIARIIFEHTGLGPFPGEQEFGAADKILAAGYSKPHDHGNSAAH